MRLSQGKKGVYGALEQEISIKTKFCKIFRSTYCGLILKHNIFN